MSVSRRSVFSRLYSSLRLMAALTALLATTASAGIDFELVLWHGYSFYYGDASLTASSPVPDTYHRVESPNALIWQNTGNNNSGSSASLSLTNDLNVLLNEVTNGLWSLTLNVGTVTQQQYAFSIDLSGVTAGLFGNATITDPALGSTIATNPPNIMWTGPSQLPSLSINVSLDGPPFTYHDGASLPSSTTSWTPGVVIPPGDQSIFLNYRTNVYAGATISVPTNLVGGASLPDWMANVDISTYAYSTFTVAGGGGGGPFDEAVESPGLNWTTGSFDGGGDWFVQSNETSVGVSALQSDAPDYTSSWLETTVMGPGTLQFDWGLFADYNDYFDFEAIDQNSDWYDGFSYAGYESYGWDWYEVSLEPGSNTLRWTFYNNDDTAGDYDAAFLDLVVYSPEADYEADFELNIQRVTSGTNSYYTMFPTLPYTFPDPISIHEVESPNALSSGQASSASSAQYATLQDLINEMEAGDWTIYFNSGTEGEWQYYFTITADSLTTNTVPPVLVLDPADGAAGVATNTDYLFLGPPGFDSLTVLARDVEAGSTLGFALLPPASTTWTNGPGLPVGTNSFIATYTSNNFQGLTITEPADFDFNPISFWTTSVEISTRGDSKFLTAGGLVPTPVMMLPPKLIGGELELSFVSQSGATHLVEYSTNLVTGPWMPATNFPGDGATNMVNMSVTNPAAYFRIETQ